MNTHIAKTATLAHLYELVLLLDPHPLGRRTLVSYSTLTESSVRTLLRRLESSGYVQADKQGTALTQKARADFGDFLRRVTLLPEPQFAEIQIDRRAAAAHVVSAGAELQRSVRYRDDAVRGGATGAVLLRHENGEWRFSDQQESLVNSYHGDARTVDECLARAERTPENGDGLILSFGPDTQSALSGLWHVIAALLPLHQSIADKVTG